jgi:hypothetical protein
MDLRGRIEVVDGDGSVVIVVQFRDVLSIVSGPLPEDAE